MHKVCRVHRQLWYFGSQSEVPISPRNSEIPLCGIPSLTRKLYCRHTTYDVQQICFWRPFVKRFALCYRTVALSVLSLTLVYCGQTVGRIKMRLGMQVGLGRPHCIKWGPSSPMRFTAPNFSACVRCGQTAGWIKMPLGIEVSLGSGDFMLDEDQAPPKMGGTAPNFRPISIVTKRLDASGYHLVQK